MLKNERLLAKIGADTAENEQHFAEIVPFPRLLLHPEVRRGGVVAPFVRRRARRGPAAYVFF